MKKIHLPATPAAKSFRPAPAVDTQKDVSKQSLASQDQNTAENAVEDKNTEGSHHDFSRIPVFAEKGAFIQRKLNDANNSSAEGLDNENKPALENFLSADLSHVRVHNNPASHGASNAINANAYTTGNHIFLGGAANSMSPVQRKSLLAHEVVHTIQQKSLSAATVQAKSIVDSPSSVHEQEADSIAGAFVQSQNTEGYRSSALQMRSNMRISSVTNPVIQRKLTTSGGDWDTVKYEKVEPAKANGLRGAEITLKFTPNNKVDAELIGLTQTAKAIKNSKPWYIGDSTRKSHGIDAKNAKTINSSTKETDEGTHIDRVAPRNNPIYGSENLASGKTLEDTPLDNKLGTGTLNVGVNATYQLGYHYYAGKVLKERDAMMWDRPMQTQVAKNASNTFEVTALGLKGKQNGIYFGSIQWGWTTDSKGKHELIPLKVISEGVPSSSFMKAAELWNAGKTSKASKSKDTLDLPIVSPVQIYAGPYDDILDIPPVASISPATRVRRLPTTDKMNVYVEVLDGPSRGVRGYVSVFGKMPFTNVEEPTKSAPTK